MEICLLLLVPLENMPFHLLVVEISMVSFQAKSFTSVHIDAKHSLSFSVNIIYSPVLLLFIINLVFVVCELMTYSTCL